MFFAQRYIKYENFIFMLNIVKKIFVKPYRMCENTFPLPLSVASVNAAETMPSASPWAKNYC